MALPLKYSISNVFVRWRSTLATIIGVALVVSVWVVLQALAAGLEKSAGNTGDARNLLITRKGADSESSSQLTREDFSIVQYADEIARDSEGQPLICADALVAVYLPRRTGDGGANVIFRGVMPRAMELRPQVKLVEGRWFAPGNREVAVSRRLAQRFSDMQMGKTVKIGARELKIVGLFDAGGSAFDSEAWMAVDEVRAVFDRANYSTLLLRPVNEAAGKALTARLEADKRLIVRTQPEVAYYAEQTKTAKPIKYAGDWIATVMSIGAIFSAMNTMYASVGARTREIGTLRVLGYRRAAVILAVLMEGAVLAFVGGIVGCSLSLYANGVSTGTFNFQTFSETVFQFSVTPALFIKGLIFSVLIGLIGSLLPALRAARMPVIVALKST